jgi:phosphatidylserine/phosphatidylglycerophosphate/cardiolipin synthase-like enzyme
MKRVFAELFNEEVLVKVQSDDPTTYRVTPEIYHAYRNYFNQIAEDIRPGAVEIAPEDQRGLASAIGEWRDWKRLHFSMNKDHFFLTGADLIELINELVKRSRSEILVVNPFVEACTPSDVLREAAPDKKVTVVLRPPADTVEKYRVKKEKYIQSLRDAGVKVVSNKRVHAKVIVFDRAVAVVSSMNLDKSSTSGSSWEAGLITKDDEVVEEIANSILNLIEKPESSEM